MTFEDNTQNVDAIVHDFNKISQIVGIQPAQCKNKAELLSYHLTLNTALHDQDLDDNQIKEILPSLSKHLFKSQQAKLEALKNLPLNRQMDFVMESIRQNLVARPIPAAVESVKEY